MSKVIATIEARMNSSRLPGKVLKPLNGIPALEQMVRRVRSSKRITDIVVATTVSANDDAVVAACEKMGCKYFRGSEEDVLQRVLDAALSVEATHIVELTGDCPLIDPAHIDATVDFYFDGNFEYVYNRLSPGLPDGFDVQVFSVKDLQRVATLTKDPIDRVHVSCFFYNNPQLFRLGCNAPAPDSGEYWPEIALTLDEEADYTLINHVFAGLSSKGDEIFSCPEILHYLKANPQLLQINENVKRKKLEDG